MLGRGTVWRQGSVLSNDDALALGLIKNEAAVTQRVVVISHDCDLACDKESFVEFIVGNDIPKSDPMLTNARNPRHLHLLFCSTAGERFLINLCQADKIAIPAMRFVEIAPAPNSEFVLEENQKIVLKQWLAARYGRPAFPDAFEKRLRKEVSKRPLEKAIAKILEPVSDHLVGLFLDMDSQRGLELEEGEAYYIKILVVYDAIEGGAAAREAADNVADAITKLFHEVYGNPEDATEIALDSCTSVADTKLNLSDLRKIDQWRVEYINLQSDPVEIYLPAGTLPV